MIRPPRPQDNDRNDVDKHRNDGDGDDDDHCGAVETNTGERDEADNIKGGDIEEADEIEEKYDEESGGEEAARRSRPTPKPPHIKGC